MDSQSVPTLDKVASFLDFLCQESLVGDWTHGFKCALDQFSGCIVSDVCRTSYYINVGEDLIGLWYQEGTVEIDILPDVYDTEDTSVLVDVVKRHALAKQLQNP